MQPLHTGLGALCLAFALCPAHPVHAAVVTADTAVFVTATNIGAPIFTSIRFRDEDFEFAHATVDLTAPGAAHSTAAANARASLGHLQAYVTVIASDIGNRGGAAGGGATASASWSDTLTLISPSLEPGHGLLVSTAYLLPGTVKLFAGVADSQAEVDVMVDGFTYFLRADDDSEDSVPPIINFTLDFFNGQSRVVSSAFGLVASAGTSDGLADASADFANSLHWGGVLSVADAVTGARITDWTLTSASGTDYSRAIGFDSATVPEPGTLGLWIAAGAVLWRSRRRAPVPSCRAAQASGASPP